MENSTKKSSSKIDNNKFYIGQIELGMIIERVIKHYRFLNKNDNPVAVVIPYLSDVEGVKIEYEKGPKTITKSEVRNLVHQTALEMCRHEGYMRSPSQSDTRIILEALYITNVALEALNEKGNIQKSDCEG